MKKIIVAIGLLLLSACSSSLKKDGTYDIVTDKAKMTLELPCKDELTQEFDIFINSIYKESGGSNADIQFKNLAIGKLIIENKTDLYIKENFSPAKVLLHLNDKTTMEGMRVEKIFSTLEYEAASMGKTFSLQYKQGQNEYVQKSYQENWIVRLMDEGPVGTILMQTRNDYAKLSSEALAPIIVVKLTLKNESDTDIKNIAEISNYTVQIVKRSKDKIRLTSLVELVASWQKMIDEKMKAQIKNQTSYNNYVNLYNAYADALKTALSEKKEIIKKGESSTEYYIAENTNATDISSVEISGGSFLSASSELKKKMLKNLILPVNPKSQSLIYLGFPNFDEKKIVKIYFSIGNYMEEMK